MNKNSKFCICIDIESYTKIKDKITIKLREFNKYIKKSSINKYILPIGDGFTVCW